MIFGTWLTVRHRVRWAVTTSTILVAGLVAVTPQAASAATITFGYNGGSQSWIVPAGVTAATFDVFGAEGGGTVPARGGQATATIALTPGEVLQIDVGGRGFPGGFTGRISDGGSGGFGGGGSGGRGGTGGCRDGVGGSGGGGASTVRRGPVRILVAGGGGGVGGGNGGSGGDGGGLAGGNGTAGSNSTAGGGGNGGTQSFGGFGGSGGTYGSFQSGAPGGNGSTGVGGSGGAGGSNSFGCGGSGGGGAGGGYYGAGGGGGGPAYSGTIGANGGAGGGGSGFGPSGVVFRSGVRFGPGLVTITPVAVPGAPAIGGATPGDRSARVSFSPPPSDGGDPITSYTATSNPGGITGTVSSSSTAVTVTGLTNGTSYTFTVHATNGVGNGPESAPSDPVIPATVPGAPTIGAATPGDRSASVSFTPPSSDGGRPITSYTAISNPGNFSYSADERCACWPQIRSGGPMTVTGLTNGTTYTFTVVATNLIGNGPPSAPSNPVTPSAVPYLTVDDVSVAEGNTSTRAATFTIRRIGNTAISSSVKYRTVDGTAVAPGDYSALAPLTALSFAAGQTTRSVNVSVRGDAGVEPDETFDLSLYSPVGATISDGSGTGTILNDDSSAPPTLAVNDVSLSEGDSGTKAATFTISRAGSTAMSASVKYRTVNGTAVAPGDYTAAAPLGAISFAIGQTTRVVNVSIRGDLFPEADETFTLSLYAPVGATISDGTGTATILNDDSSAPTAFSVNDVSIPEGNTLTKALTFTITRSGNISGTSSVKYHTADGSAIAPGDYTAKALTTLSFAAGQTSKLVSVTIRGDRLVEANETFVLALSAPVAAIISDASGTGTILNDD